MSVERPQPPQSASPEAQVARAVIQAGGISPLANLASEAEYRAQLPEVRGQLEDFSPEADLEPSLGLSPERQAEQARRQLERIEGNNLLEILRTNNKIEAMGWAGRQIMAILESTPNDFPDLYVVRQLRTILGNRGLTAETAQNQDLVDRLGLDKYGIGPGRVSRVVETIAVKQVLTEEQAVQNNQGEWVIKRMPVLDNGQPVYVTHHQPRFDQEGKLVYREVSTELTAQQREQLQQFAQRCELLSEEIEARKRLGIAYYLYNRAAGDLPSLGKLFIDSNFNQVRSTDWARLFSKEPTMLGELAFGEKIDQALRLYTLLARSGGDYIGVRLDDSRADRVEAVVGERLSVFDDGELLEIARAVAGDKDIPQNLSAEAKRGQNLIRGRTIEQIEKEVKKPTLSPEQKKELGAILKFHEFVDRRDRIRREIDGEGNNSLRAVLKNKGGVVYDRLDELGKRELVLELVRLAEKNLFCATPSSAKLKEVRGWVTERIGGDQNDTAAAEEWAWRTFKIWGMAAFYDSRKGWKEDGVTRQLRPSPSGQSASDDLIKVMHFEDYRTRESGSWSKDRQQLHNPHDHGPDATQGKYPNTLIVDFLRKTIVNGDGNVDKMASLWELWWNDGLSVTDLPWVEMGKEPEEVRTEWVDGVGKIEIRGDEWYRFWLPIFFAGTIGERSPLNMYAAALHMNWRRDELIDIKTLRELSRTAEYVVGPWVAHNGEIAKFVRQHPEAARLSSDEFIAEFVNPKREEVKELILLGAIANAFLSHSYPDVAKEWALWWSGLKLPAQDWQLKQDLQMKEEDFSRILQDANFLDKESIKDIVKNAEILLKSKKALH